MTFLFHIHQAILKFSYANDKPNIVHIHLGIPEARRAKVYLCGLLLWWASGIPCLYQQRVWCGFPWHLSESWWRLLAESEYECTLSYYIQAIGYIWTFPSFCQPQPFHPGQLLGTRTFYLHMDSFDISWAWCNWQQGACASWGQYVRAGWP